MPEATVHEDRDPLLAEYEIGLPKDRGMPPPAGDAVLSKNRSKSQFGALVGLASDTGHDLRPLGLGEDIAHTVTVSMEP